LFKNAVGITVLLVWEPQYLEAVYPKHHAICAVGNIAANTKVSW